MGGLDAVVLAGLRHLVEPGAELPGLELEKLDVGQMVNNINRAMTALENIIAAGDLEKLVGNIETAARDVAELAREMRERAGALTETIQTTARDAQTLMQSLDRQVDPVAGEAVQTMAQVRETLLRVDKALAAADGIDLVIVATGQGVPSLPVLKDLKLSQGRVLWQIL